MTVDQVLVVNREYALPYSKGLMSQSLMATGLSPLRSYQLARLIENRLFSRGELQISVRELREIAEDVLGAEESEDVVARYRNWQRLDRLERPLLVLIGGATGTGKSTLATMLAHRLAVTRVFSTDLIRQVLRAFFSVDFMPAVHHSSFDSPPNPDEIAERSGDPVVEAFKDQADSVLDGVNAIIARAIHERTPMVIEGAHLIPGRLDPELLEQAVTVHVMLYVGDEDVHRSHFFLRGANERRPPARYLESFDRIRTIQGFLTQEAESNGTSMVENRQLDQSISEVLQLVLNEVKKEAPSPKN